MCHICHASVAKGTMQEALSLRLQASMPSAHVWSTFSSSSSPQVRCQLPSRAQQLGLPELVVPHFGHARLTALMVAMVVVGNGESID